MISDVELELLDLDELALSDISEIIALELELIAL